MQEQKIPIPFPMGGLAVAGAIADQPEGTTASCLNVVGYDPRFGRDRGGQRAGLSKYCPTQIAGANPIQEITKVVSTSLASGAVLPSNALIGVFAYSDENSPSAVVLSTPDFGHQIGVGTGQPVGYCWDESNRFYVAVVTGGQTQIQAYKISTLGVTLSAQSLWTSINLPNHHASHVVGMTYGDGFLWVATENASALSVFLYKLSLADGTIVTGADVFNSAHHWSTRAASPIAYIGGTTPKVALGYSTGLVELYDVGGGAMVSGTPFAADVLDLSSDGTSIYGVNMTPDISPASTEARIYQMDKTAAVIWRVSEGAFLTLNSHLDSSVSYDPVSGVVYTGHGGDSGFSGSSNTAWHLGKFGAADGKEKATTGGGPYRSVRANGLGGFYACQPTGWGSVTPTALTVENHDSSLAMTGTFSTSTANTGVPRFIAVNLGASTGAGGGLSPRFIRPLACSAGNIRKFNRTGITQITNGELALSATAPVVFATQLLQAVYFFDGVNWKYYDIASDKILTLTPSAGALPVDSAGNTPRLGVVWRNRLVVAGLINDPFNWFMCALRDATNWNYNPVPFLESAAVAGNNVTSDTPVGESPDVINALCPYSDEILLFGGDHTIHQMTGDPAAGGRIDMVTDAIGMAFGRPYCRDGQGRLYFFSNRGTIYLFVPGGIPEPISANIAEQLINIDLGQYIVRMAWAERHQAFDLWITPFNNNVATQHYRYDTRTKAWWPVQYGNTGLDPLCVAEWDGDTVADRTTLIGCKDGFVRQVDVNALDDDGTPINSYVMIGPVKSGTALYSCDLQCTLDAYSSPINYGVFTGSYAQEALASAARQVGQFNPGRNRSQPIRVFGHAQYIMLNGRQKVGEAWQLETLEARIRVPEGKGRERTF